MYELINYSFFSYLLVTLFTGLWVIMFLYGIFKKTKKLENKQIRILIQVGISSVVTCVWIYYFICINLYPISLAKHEYNNDLYMEKEGVIDIIEYDVKDRIHIVIDDTKYTMIYSSISPLIIIGKDINEGDNVKIRFGAKSNYIFDIESQIVNTD